jgi:hypothetical protein
LTNLEFLKEFISTTISDLEYVLANGVKNELTFTINCSELEDYNFVDIRKSKKFEPIFDQLKKTKGPTLYWFEIISDTDTEVIINALKSYKKNGKATPALGPKINFDSKILYVGKVKGTFWGRLIQHLGFFKVNATQGLQLFCWAKPLSLTLKINVLEFEDNMADIMPIIEFAFAKKLQPLVGKHK